MSYSSINKNNNSIVYIDKAIAKYESAISTIKKTNSNPAANAIIGMINSDISNLNTLKKELKSINSQISREMRKKEESEEQS